MNLCGGNVDHQVHSSGRVVLGSTRSLAGDADLRGLESGGLPPTPATLCCVKEEEEDELSQHSAMLNSLLSNPPSDDDDNSITWNSKIDSTIAKITTSAAGGSNTWNGSQQQQHPTQRLVTTIKTTLQSTSQVAAYAVPVTYTHHQQQPNTPVQSLHQHPTSAAIDDKEEEPSYPQLARGQATAANRKFDFSLSRRPNPRARSRDSAPELVDAVMHHALTGGSSFQVVGIVKQTPQLLRAPRESEEQEAEDDERQQHEFHGSNSRSGNSSVRQEPGEDEEEGTEDEIEDDEESNAQFVNRMQKEFNVVGFASHQQHIPHDCSISVTTSSTLNTISTPHSVATGSRRYMSNRVSHYNASASPTILNPMSEDYWEKARNKMKSVRPLNRNAFHAARLKSIENTKTIESLIKRLGEGFHVTLHGQARSELGEESSSTRVFLYLHSDLENLCLRCDDGKEDSTDNGDTSIAIPVRKVLRLEIGKTRSAPRHIHPMCCFSIVASQDANICYYDFEATSAVEREVLVSTLMVVLDYMHNPLESSRHTVTNSPLGVPPNGNGNSSSNSVKHIDSFDFGGTMDQPIPCSPSLEQQLSDGLSHLSPRKRTHIFNGSNIEETETSLVIVDNDSDLLDEGLIDPILCLGGGRGAKSGQSSSPQGKDHQEPRLVSKYGSHSRGPTPRPSGVEIPEREDSTENKGVSADDYDCRNNEDDADTSNNHPESGASAVQVAGGAWCTDDVCSSAIKDIANTCTGIFALRKVQTPQNRICEPVSDEQLRMIEEYFATALGAPSAMYTYLTHGDVWNVESSGSPAISPTKDAKGNGANNFVRNRASRLNAQATRLRSLRNEMTFASALQASKEKMHYIQTTQSLDETNLARENPKLRVASEVANRFHTSALLQHVVKNMMTRQQEQQSIELDDEDVAFYDSDPEDVRPRTIHREGPRRVSAKLENRNDDFADQNRPRALSQAGFEVIGSGKRVSKKLDEDVIVEIVQAMNNERLTLIWHPTQSKSRPNRHPMCVRVWIESGVYLGDGTFILPKLCWAKAPDTESKQLKLTKEDLHKLDLLDVCRIRPTVTVNRLQHPFVDKRVSFSIETQSRQFVFESESIEERDRIVYGLKLVIARLASLLMLRDIRAAEEFFGIISATVPGEPPAIITGKQSVSSNRNATSPLA